ncbi:MAG: EAL domain-containing protein [Lachnospiraceae bacterium]|nr:EAL domain-containing protein [Lachnospiraceae bacterium]
MDMPGQYPAERKRRLDELFDAFSIIGDDTYVYLCDMRYDISRWSRTLVESYGLPGEYMHAAGEIWEEYVHPEDRKAYHEGIDAIFNGKASDHDIQYRAKRTDGEYDVCTCRGIVISDQDGQPEYFGGAIRNHSKQSHIDTLTGLRNQYGFFEDIMSHIKNNTPMRVCVLGIGKLSEINEVHGYGAGNIVIQHFGRYLMDHIGNRGGTYRLDGGKFAVISETLTYDELKNAYEALRAYFRGGLSVEDAFIALELNAGTLYIDDFNTDEQTVYSCLNFAYDDSKIRKHGDLVEFQNKLTSDNKARVEKLHAIRTSVNHGFDGFYLLYQPVVDAQTEKLIGAEALLRFKNEKYGMVPPDAFIPFLEMDPVFPKLGEWILRTAISGAKAIQSVLPDFQINVNLSYSQMEKADFTDTVWNIVKSLGFPPEKLCLEVTERCRLLDMDLLKNETTNLRAGGIRLALDDFGTGFSSVGLLKSLPFDTIKVDRGFVQKIEEDEQERKLVNNFIDVAKVFDADVCVEGIETAGMRDILKSFGIHSFQGYYYSKPIELESILERLRTSAGALCFRK